MANRSERAGVTFEMVAAAADGLVAQGQAPTIRGVREALGTGSPNTIHKHLTTWREARPHVMAATPELPGDITRVILDSIERAAAEARAEVGADLVRAQAEAADLAAAGERMEVELADHLEQLGYLSEQLHRLSGELQARKSELERVTADLERERQRAEQLVIEVAQGRNRVQTLEERLTEREVELKELRVKIEEEAAHRVAAEKEAAVALAKYEMMEKRTEKG